MLFKATGTDPGHPQIHSCSALLQHFPDTCPLPLPRPLTNSRPDISTKSRQAGDLMKTPLVVGVEAPAEKPMKSNLVSNTSVGCSHFFLHIAEVTVLVAEVCGNTAHLNGEPIDLLPSA